ncbi:MAG: hypothetical protein KBE23_15485 [Chloroflexi bacterium]|nr:hypothetical protein [Chloroflexota bacterium]MBP7044150.1 hypothetical protein [Chloroflexota bacterium]
MPIFYMTFWSIVVILAVGVWRLRSWLSVFTVSLITVVILMLSQALFVQLALSAGLDPSLVLIDPSAFLRSGPLGWLALLVMPCGWLGPVLGLNLVERWHEWQQEPG